jgi:putative aldouronate transport system substrate-binding protein
MDVWQEGADTAYAMPNLTLTSDESSTATNIESELSTYVSEYLLKVIVGETDLASTWDSYLNTLDNMGVNTVIGIYQDALDRYNAR